MALRVVNTLSRSLTPLTGVVIASNAHGMMQLLTTSAAPQSASANEPDSSSSSTVAQAVPEAAAAAARLAFTFEEPLEPPPPKAFYFEEPLNSASLSDTENDAARRSDRAVMNDTPPSKTFYFDEPLNSGGVSDSEIDSRPLTQRIEDYELRMAEKLDSRVRGGGFVASSDAVPNIESAGLYGGPGTAAMADMVDMVGGAFGGQNVRVAKAVGDLSRGVPGPAKPPRTASQSWPRASLQPEGAQPDTDQAVLDYCMKNRARGL